MKLFSKEKPIEATTKQISAQKETLEALNKKIGSQQTTILILTLVFVTPWFFFFVYPLLNPISYMLSHPDDKQGQIWVWLFGGPFIFTSLVAFIPLVVNIVILAKLSRRKNFFCQKEKTKANSLGISVLLESILTQNTDSVRTALAEHPEHLNTAYAQNGNTPLHVAALNGETEIVKLLLTQPGIDKTLKNNDGKTARDLAQEKGFAEITDLLK